MITYDNISNIGELTNVAEYDDDDVGDILLMSGLPLEKKVGVSFSNSNIQVYQTLDFSSFSPPSQHNHL